MKGKKTGGRRPGSPNKMTGAHGDLLAAWDKVSGPETAKQLMKSAISEAVGREEPVLDDKGEPVLDKKGKPKVKKLAPNFDPLAKILPYIARRMPETIEVEDAPGMTLEDALAIIKRASL